MKKKGAVYRLTMMVGFLIIGGQLVGESSYSFYKKEARNQEIEAARKQSDRINALSEEEDEEGKGGLLRSREDYKQQRLKRIKEARSKQQDSGIAAPTMEEMQAKPSIRERKLQPLVKRDETLHAREDKDNYM